LIFAGSVLRKYASKGFMEEPPKERKILIPNNLRGLRFLLSCKEVIEKSQEGFFQHSAIREILAKDWLLFLYHDYAHSPQFLTL